MNDKSDFFRQLRQIIDDYGKGNKHDLAIVLITICIEKGIDTGPQIIGALKSIGMNHKHIALLLKRETGAAASGFRWWRDDDGRYWLHEAELTNA